MLKLSISNISGLLNRLGLWCNEQMTSGKPSARELAKTPLFVVGCQRSGTTMLLQIMDKSPYCSIFHESDRFAYEKTRIRSDQRIRAIIRRSPTPVPVFKPINDSQHADRFLAMHPHAKCVWLFRNYFDVVNSAVSKWKSAQKTIMNGIARGQGQHPDYAAINDRMSPQTRQLIQNLSSEDMSSEDGAALLWYVRNRIYFDLDLASQSRVLLVKYEDLVTSPELEFKRIFAHAGCPFEAVYTQSVHLSSVGKKPAPPISNEIKKNM